MRYLRYTWTIFLIFIVLLFILPKLKDVFQEIPMLFKEANKFFLALLFFSQCLSYLGDALLSQVILKMTGLNMKLRNIIKIAILDVLSGHLVPVLGGPIISYYFFRKLKVPSDKILFLLPAWTSFVWLIYLLSFIFSIFFLPISLPYVVQNKIIYVVAGGAIFIFLFGHFLFKNRGKNLILLLNFFVDIINRIWKHTIKKDLVNFARIKNFISDYYETIKLLGQHKTKIPWAIFAAALFYLGDIITLYFSFLVFGLHPNFALLNFGFIVSILLPLFTFSSAVPGTMVASLTLVFTQLGFPAHIVIISVLLFRLFSYWFPLLLGALSFFMLKRDIKSHSS